MKLAFGLVLHGIDTLPNTYFGRSPEKIRREPPKNRANIRSKGVWIIAATAARSAQLARMCTWIVGSTLRYRSGNFAAPNG